jgi:hypothetical protein
MPPIRRALSSVPDAPKTWAKLEEAPINGTGRASSFSLVLLRVESGRPGQMQGLEWRHLLAAVHGVPHGGANCLFALAKITVNQAAHQALSPSKWFDRDGAGREPVKGATEVKDAARDLLVRLQTTENRRKLETRRKWCRHIWRAT